MIVEFKIDKPIYIEDSIIEKFKQASEYVKQNPDEVDNAGYLSVVEKFFDDNDISMVGMFVLSEMLPDIDEEACANN